MDFALSIFNIIGNCVSTMSVGIADGLSRLVSQLFVSQGLPTDFSVVMATVGGLGLTTFLICFVLRLFCKVGGKHHER